MKRYYLPFNPSANVNYLYLFSLYDLAEYDADAKAFNTIKYVSLANLAELMGVSPSTVYRMTNINSKNDYLQFLTIDKAERIITLNNTFANGMNTNKIPFVVLTDKEVQLLREKNDLLLCRYLMYVKYYCGYSKSKTTDFTQEQFLSACCYSANSNGNKDKLSYYNDLLADNGFLRIEVFRDNLGKKRNRYAYSFNT